MLKSLYLVCAELEIDLICFAQQLELWRWLWLQPLYRWFQAAVWKNRKKDLCRMEMCVSDVFNNSAALGWFRRLICWRNSPLRCNAQYILPNTVIWAAKLQCIKLAWFSCCDSPLCRHLLDFFCQPWILIPPPPRLNTKVTKAEQKKVRIDRIYAVYKVCTDICGTLWRCMHIPKGTTTCMYNSMAGISKCCTEETKTTFTEPRNLICFLTTQNKNPRKRSCTSQ